MKRGGFLQRRTAFLRHAPISRYKPTSIEEHNSTSAIKERIQALLRAIVITRDGGCILRDPYLQARWDIGPCNGFRNDGQLVLQGEHLIERSNSATYADTRLAVCVCKGHHGWKHFKDSNKEKYDAIIRTLLEPNRVTLWERCKADSWRPTPKYTSDWLKEEAALKGEFAKLQHLAAGS